MNNISRRQLLTPGKATIFSLVLMSLITPEIHAGLMKNLMNRAYSFLGYETCEHPNIHNAAVRRLRNAFKNELFGQHLAADIIVKAVKAHIDDPSPQKALVLSLHGWAGAGKTFTSQLLMNALYDKGMNSSYIRFFMSSYHFPDPNKVHEYYELLKRNINEVVQKCHRALFVFDEVDKTPPGVLDALVPFIQHPGEMLDRVNYKRVIFVFLSNSGANEITKITQTAWKDGRNRDELYFKDFEQTLSNEAFNSKGGLYKSRVIDKVLVDYFVPFLPLERQHVISCIKVEAKRQGMDSSIINDEAEKIADMLTYWPADLKLYSTTGCKKVDTFVKYRMAELRLAAGENDDDENDEDDESSKTEL